MAASSLNYARAELKEFLDEKADLYNTTAFIETDPILVPHQFHNSRDIEISAFLTATIAWAKKHVTDITRGASAKRINMFMRINKVAP